MQLWFHTCSLYLFLPALLRISLLLTILADFHPMYHCPTSNLLYFTHVPTMYSPCTVYTMSVRVSCIHLISF